MPKNKRMGECIYCRKFGEITDDHIPPTNLFPKPKPSNLITVPSCKKCNSESSKDDEYFRMVISMRHDTFEHPEVIKNRHKILRSFQRPNKKGLLNLLAKNLSTVDLYSQGGIYLGKTGACNVDMKRVNAVIKRITLGLFYKEKGRGLPDSYLPYVYCISDVKKLLQNPVKEILASTFQGKVISIGNEIFKYWYKTVSDEENCISLILSFYNRVNFFAFTLPKEKL